MATRNEAFAERFNQALGRHTGTQITPRSYRPVTSDVARQAGLSVYSTSTKALTAAQKKLDSQRKQRERAAKSDYKLADDVANIKTTEEGKKQNPLIKRATDYLTGGPIALFGGPNIGKAILGTEVGKKTSDYLTHPLNAFNQSLINTYDTMGQDTFNVPRYLGGLTSGTWEGLSGQSHASGSDVILSRINNSDQGPGFVQFLVDPTGMFKKQKKILTDPNADPKDKRMLQSMIMLSGLAQDLVADPLNWVGGSHALGRTATAVDEGGDILRSVNALDEGRKLEGVEAVLSNTDRAIWESLQTNPLPKGRKGIDLGTDLRKEVQDFAVNNSAEVAGGAQRGRVISGTDEAFKRAVASKTAMGWAERYTARVEADLARIKKIIEGGKSISSFVRDAIVRDNPGLEPFFKEMEAGLIAGDTTPIEQRIVKYVERLREETYLRSQSIYDDMYRALDTRVFNQPVMRVGKHTIRLLPASASRSISELLGGIPKSRLFSYSENFPGLTADFAQKARAQGIAPMDDWMKALADDFSHLTRGDREALHLARAEGKQLSSADGRLEAAQQKLNDWYDWIYDMEANHYKLRNPGSTPRNPNYVYEYAKGKTTPSRAWKDVRKDLLRSQDPGWYAKLQASREAKAVKGVRSLDAVDNVAMRIVKMQRDAIRQNYLIQALNLYGIPGISHMTKPALNALDLVKIPTDKLPDYLQAIIKSSDTANRTWYLPKEVANVVKTLSEGMQFRGAGDETDLVNMIDDATKFFKSISTIYYPGFHIRNAISDWFMGLLDGVHLQDYKDIYRADRKLDAGLNPLIRVGGKEIPLAELRGSYVKSLTAGSQVRGDIAVMDDLTKTPTKVNKWVRDVSQTREDFGRFAHFKHAMDEEWPTAIGKFGDTPEAWDKAVDAATYRVNKYKVDYGALTPFEAKVMKRVIPFYTYQRRIMPVLLEAMLLNPNLMNVPTKFFQNLTAFNDENGSPNMLQLPTWMREIGFAPFTGSDNPWGFAVGNLLPTNVFQPYMGGPNEMLNAGLAQLNPIAQIPLEAVTKKDIYSGRDIGGFSESLAGTLRPVSFAQAMSGRNLNPFGDKFLQPMSPKPWAERWLQTVAGLPVYNVTDARLEGARYATMAQMENLVKSVDEDLSQIGYKIYIANLAKGQRIRIAVDQDGGKVVYETKSLEDALKYAEGMMNNA